MQDAEGQGGTCEGERKKEPRALLAPELEDEVAASLGSLTGFCLVTVAGRGGHSWVPRRGLFGGRVELEIISLVWVFLILRGCRW